MLWFGAKIHKITWFDVCVHISCGQIVHWNIMYIRHCQIALDRQQKTVRVVVLTSRLNLSDGNVLETCYHLFRAQTELPSRITVAKVNYRCSKSTLCSASILLGDLLEIQFFCDWLALLQFNHLFPSMELNNIWIVNPFETMSISCYKSMISNMLIKSLIYKCFTISALWLFSSFALNV